MHPKSSDGRKLKILCLHGYAQNAEFFRQRTGSIRKKLKSTCDFHFLNVGKSYTTQASSTRLADPIRSATHMCEPCLGQAPHEATASFLPTDVNGDAGEGRGDQRGWWNAAEAAESPGQSKTYVGLEDSLALARQTLQEDGPFDGLLGFSQGATLGAILCLAPSSLPPLPPLRFAVLVSGFMPRDPALELLVGTADGRPPLRVPLPSLHVMGENDQLVAATSSRRLSDCFAGATLHYHEGGHLVPSSADFRALLKDFVTRLGVSDAAAPNAAATAAVSLAGLAVSDATRKIATTGPALDHGQDPT